MKISNNALNLIKKWEGFRETAYLCPAKVWTIGYGTTRYSNGQPVKQGDKITQVEALKLLEKQVNEHASTIETYVKVLLTINQFDALSSFQYNLGKHILKDSALLSYINNGQWDLVAKEMSKYNKVSGKVSQGLVNRRKEEVELFLKDIDKLEVNRMGKNFICPVKNARLTSAFGYRTIAGKREFHQGIDLASNGRVPIYASADGTVIRAQSLSSYGNVVMIRHNINGKRMETNYAHLDSYSVKVGQKVKQGEQIGIMGATGRSYGVHLHFEVHNGEWKSGQPNAVNAMNYISLNDWDNKDTGGLTVSEYNKLIKLIESQNAKIKDLENKLSNKMDILSEREVGKSHKEAWLWSEKEGLLNGKNPESHVSREQLSTVMKRLFDKLKK